MNRNSTRHSSVSSSLKTLFFFFLRLAIRMVKQINLNLTTPCLTLFDRPLAWLPSRRQHFEFMPALRPLGILSVQRASRCLEHLMTKIALPGLILVTMQRKVVNQAEIKKLSHLTPFVRVSLLQSKRSKPPRRTGWLPRKGPLPARPLPKSAWKKKLQIPRRIPWRRGSMSCSLWNWCA